MQKAILEFGSFAINISSLVGVNIIFSNFLNVLDGSSHNDILTSFSVSIKNLSGLKLLFELGGSCGILEFCAKLFKLALNLIREIVAHP
tara:strand:- start:441 stop:707 length:267 start_codon:yes stop_codon:yes gene_type:complete